MRKLFRNQQLILFLIQRSFFGNGLCVSQDQKSTYYHTGGLIGFIGHTLVDLSWGGIPWWSWVITSAFVGVVIGAFARKLNVQEGDFGKAKAEYPVPEPLQPIR